MKNNHINFQKVVYSMVAAEILTILYNNKILYISL